MASKFQNRLVGTVILVALVVIFLPDLMDGNKLEQKDEAFAKIPLRPELEPAKPALQVSAASTLPAEHLASQQQASAATQWQVEEIGDTVTLANQGGANPAGASQAPITQQQPVQAVVQPKPQPKPEPKPEVIAKKPVEQPKAKRGPTKQVAVQERVAANARAPKDTIKEVLTSSKIAKTTSAGEEAAPAQRW
ncbi:DedD protein, partial [Aeromonas caviae]|uniref:DedD protein n=1 Tax=Aeromonas caviae TaxID=648 RepID=UPI0025B63AC2